MAVELLAFVVQRRHPHLRRGNVSRDGDARLPRNALREHEGLELLARELLWRVEHGDVEVLVERNLARLERSNGFFVTVLEIFRVDAESLDGGSALLAIPAVAAEDAADVEQNELDGGC